MIRAGAGKAKLKLPETIFPIEKFRYVHDDLICRVIVLEQQESLVFVSLDLTSLQDYAISVIKKQISKHYAVPLNHIFISVSHTFSAPHTRSIETLEQASVQIKTKNQLFLDIILEAVTCAIKKAVETIQPIKIIGHTIKTNSTVNRDIEQKDGYWIGRNPEGFSSGDVPMIKFVNERKEILAVIYSLDVQSSLVEAIDDEAVSSDFVGKVSSVIENYFDCTALFMLGAAGDQIPRYMSRNFQDLARQASELGNILIREITEADSEIEGNFVLNTLVITVKGQEMPDRKELKPTRNYHFISSADRQVIIPILTFGEIAIVMMKPEITSIVGASIREQSPYMTTLVATMINGGQKYMADEASYQKYTYEAMNSMFACGSAEIIRAKVIEELVKRK